MHGLSWEDPEYLRKFGRKKPITATSIFDPVLTEVLTLWFSRPGDEVYDPFSGAPPRGVVSHALNRRYTGIELRPEQVAANYENFAEIKKAWPNLTNDHEAQPEWLQGSSTDDYVADRMFDFVITCPPYGDLEVYSDDPADLSTMSYEAFLEAYTKSLAIGYEHLRDDRFYSIVIGEFRDKEGSLRNFVGDTARILKDIGLNYQNEMILLTSLNTASLRTRGFNASRKAVRVHQNVQVFVKGDPRRAAERVRDIGPIIDLTSAGRAGSTIL